MIKRSIFILVLVFLTAPFPAAHTIPPPAELVPIVWVERAPDAPAGTLPAFRVIEDTARVAQANGLSDNEAARFVRQLIARAWRMAGGYTSAEAVPALPVVLQPGGNYARQGLRILRAGGYVEQPDMPYLLLDLNEGSLSLTFLHEGGHVVDRIVRRSRPEPAWSALLHSTFAVMDPLTALNPPLVIRRDGSSETLTKGGMVLGVFPENTYKQAEVCVSPGDRLVFYTDGITEARDPAGEEYGEVRLLAAALAVRSQSADSIKTALIDHVNRFHRPIRGRRDADRRRDRVNVAVTNDRSVAGVETGSDLDARPL